ncbi:MAG TPA: ATP-binding cassette domain-containing protein [Microvirga sp.]
MTAGMPVPMLIADGIAARYRESAGEPVEALRVVTAQFAPGRLTAVMGPSGSGKTTLIHALAGIMPVSAGEIRFGDAAVSRLIPARRDAWRYRTCGLVFQDFRLMDELGTIENVVLPITFAKLRVGAEARTRAKALLDRFEVPQRSSSVSQLSRGQRQRVALARALILDPPIILADEPTASLDPENGERIAREFESLALSGKIVVCVTHDERVAAGAAVILRMQDGRLAGDGATAPAIERKAASR